MDVSVITARCFCLEKHHMVLSKVFNLLNWWRKSADVFFNNYVAARPAKDTTDKMLGIISEASTARNSLSTIQIWEAVMKSSVSRSVIEDIDKEDIFEEEYRSLISFWG